MSLFNNIQSKRILVIGDVMLDTYFTGDVTRISPEAPVPVFRKKGERHVPGGAGNVAANLIAAGQQVSLMSVIGNDYPARLLSDIFQAQGINTELLFTADRSTTEKTRFLASNNQQVIRLDAEDASPLPDDVSEAMLEALRQRIKNFDLILISDYMKGLLTYDFTREAIHMAGEYGIPVVADVKGSQANKYYKATLLKPNVKELHDLTGMPVENDEQIVAASRFLRDTCACGYVLTTCGARGMVLVGEGEPYFVNALQQEVYDVSGAGDTTIAYMAACMVNGLTLKEAVDIANLAAGIQVAKVGTSSVYWREVREKLSRQDEGTIHKLISGKAVENFRQIHKDDKIVFTNGCFDILHIGHIRYLQEAARLGDILVVGLNSDASVKRLKGPERPVNTQLDRAEILGALNFIDYIVMFEEETPLELIKQIQPDVLVKGGDYKPQDVVGKEEVEARGGKLVLLPFVDGKSTTNIIEKIRQ